MFAELCKRSLSFFVKEFWDTIVPNKLQWNWHLDVLCDEIQQCDERVFLRQPKHKDLIINVPPGTSKTKVVSVMSTAWEFARMPSIKVFVGSYSDGAVAGIADEIRLLMKSDKYKSYFPKTIIRQDRDSLHNFRTTDNGEFYAFTVGGTLTSKQADILKCLPYNQTIQTDAGCLEIGDIVSRKLPVKVLSYNSENNTKEYKEILKYEQNEGQELIEIESMSGKKVVCTLDHLIFTHNRGYVQANNLLEDDIIETY